MGCDDGADAAIRRRKLLFVACGNGLQIEARLLQSNSLLDSADRFPLMIAALAQIFLRHIERNPHFGVAGSAIPRGHHADQRVRFAVQRNGFAQNLVRCRKSRLPERVAQNRDFASALLIFARGKRASNLRIYAEQGKEVSFGLDDGGAFRRRSGRNVGVGRPGKQRHVLEGAVLRFPVEIVLRQLSGKEPGRAFGLPEGNDFFRIAKWERLQQRGVDDREDRGVRANAPARA